MTDDLRDHLRGMADGAAARTSDLDTGRLVEFVGAARRRRDQRQRIAVGGLAIALVGGVAYGGMQMFGDGGGPVAGVTGPSDNQFCGWSIGASEDHLLPENAASNSRVAVISYDESYSNTEPELIFAYGDRTGATTVDGLNLTLFNNTDLTFEADSVWIDVYVARENEVIAAPRWDSSDVDAVDLSLPSGEIATVPIRSPLMCAGQSMDGDGVFQVFAVASGTFTGADGDVETWRATFDDASRMTGIGFSSLTGGDGPSPDYSTDIWLWGGAWTVSKLTDIPELPGPQREVSSEFPGWEDARCGDVFPIMRHAGNEPRLVATDTQLDLPEPERGPEYGYENSGLGLSPDDVSGTRAAAAVWLLNPEDGEHVAGGSTGYVSTIVVRDGLVVGTYGDMLDPGAAFNLDPGYAVQLKITAAEHCEGFGDKVLDTDEIYYVLDAQRGDDFRDRTLIWGGPWTLRDPALPDPQPTEPQPSPTPTPSADPTELPETTGIDYFSDIDRSDLPDNGTVVAPVCSFQEENVADLDGAGAASWQSECPFSVQNSLGEQVEPEEIENVTSWLMLSDNAYRRIHANYGSLSLRLEISDANGELIAPTHNIFGDARMRHLTLTPDNAWPIPAVNQTWGYDWNGLEAGTYFARFTLDLALEGIEHNPDFTNEPSLPEFTNVDPWDGDDLHYSLTSTWTVEFSIG